MRRFLRLVSPRNTLMRFIYAAVLVFGTYNPSEYNMYNFLKESAANFVSVWPQFILAVLVIVALWIVFLTSIRQAMGILGLILACLIFGLVGYIPFHQGWIEASSNPITWVSLAAITCVLGLGASFSTWRFRFFGQRTVDHVEGDVIETTPLDHEDN